MDFDADIDHQDVAVNLAAIQAEICEAAAQMGRDAAAISLIAVSKTHSTPRIRPALEAGHRVFGENRVQELKQKWPPLREEFPDLDLHLIGPLQTNKLRDAVALADVIQSVDREKLAYALAREAEKCGRLPRLLIQVNTGEEAQKTDILPEQADHFIALCRDDLALPIDGLMAIPPANEEPSPHFALLGKIADRNNLSVKSMGMSGDYITAIHQGATHIRIGTAIFGARNRPEIG